MKVEILTRPELRSIPMKDGGTFKQFECRAALHDGVSKYPLCFTVSYREGDTALEQGAFYALTVESFEVAGFGKLGIARAHGLVPVESVKNLKAA